jgi:RNA polymerase sigma factor (sigma-70 family)
LNDVCGLAAENQQPAITTQRRFVLSDRKSPMLRSASVDPDLGLLESWWAGDSRAGQDLFARHFADIYRFFEHKVGPEADELAQRTFMACVAARDRFRGSSTFRTFLFAIARNQLYTFLRQLPKAEHVDFEHTSIADLVPSLGSQLGHARDAERLRIALSTLPAEQQLLLELHYWHELDAEALGEVFDTTPGAIRVRLLRTRKALRERMGQLDLDRLRGASQDSLIAALSEPEHEAAGSRT